MGLQYKLHYFPILNFFFSFFFLFKEFILSSFWRAHFNVDRIPLFASISASNMPEIWVIEKNEDFSLYKGKDYFQIKLIIFSAFDTCAATSVKYLFEKKIRSFSIVLVLAVHLPF